MNDPSPMLSYLSFHVDSQRCGIRLDEVIQILHMLILTELPGETPDVLGLMTLHESVMPVIDLRIRFGTLEPDYKLNTPIVAIRTPHGMAGLIVDAVDTVEHVRESDIIPYQGKRFSDVRGIVTLPLGTLLLLDTERLTREIQLPG